jgi:pyruvate, water dikinase
MATAVRIMKGNGASNGVVEGPCRVISRREDLRFVRTGDVLMCRTAAPCLSGLMGKLKGLVTEQGGQLTIAAQYAREHEVPHVAGVNGLLATVRNGQMVRIDGSKGTVSLL